MTTVADIFNKLDLTTWWDQNRVTQAFGENGEEGADYGLGGFGKPVGSITAGKVVYVGNGGYPGSSIGQVVQVLNNDGSLLHYQHLMTSNVVNGQIVQVGDVIGKGGGCVPGGYPSDLSLSSCTIYDKWSSGQHIEVRYSPTYNPASGLWSQNWLDPRQIFSQIAGNAASAPTNNPAGNPLATTTDAATSGGGLINFGNIGTKIGIFLLALAGIIGGLYIIFQHQVNDAVATGTKDAAKAAILA